MVFTLNFYNGGLNSINDVSHPQFELKLLRYITAYPKYSPEYLVGVSRVHSVRKMLIHAYCEVSAHAASLQGNQVSILDNL